MPVPSGSAAPDADHRSLKHPPALFVDLYELTMMQAYLEHERTDEAVFDLYVRRLPDERNYLIAAGLDEALAYLESLRFSEESLAYLASLGSFGDDFIEYLDRFRFTGDVYAVPEGTPVFPFEPILEIVAPLPEAQFVETFLINQVQLQTLMATKARRLVTAARGRAVVDFGSRRAHGLDSALKGARAFFIAGVDATSNVMAGHTYGIPLSGTMAHSYVETYRDERRAFETFMDTHPDTVLLVDTYDTLGGVQRVIELAEAWGDRFEVRAIRLDSGDRLELSCAARQLLDAAGLQRVQIFASGGLNEQKIGKLLAADAPIDGFGVGTSLSVSRDVPALDIVYKLVAYAGTGRMKLSAGKSTLPSRKQVFRFYEQGKAVRDVIALYEETLPEGKPLLQPVMKGGKRLPAAHRALPEIRRDARSAFEQLPKPVQALDPASEGYPVSLSARLEQERDAVREVLERSPVEPTQRAG